MKYSFLMSPKTLMGIPICFSALLTEVVVIVLNKQKTSKFIFTMCVIVRVSAKALILLSDDMSLSSFSNCFSRLFRL